MKETTWLPKVRAIAVSMMMNLIRDDLAALGIEHEVLFSERSLSEGETDQVRETIEELRAKGLVYVGRLDPPKGKMPEDWEDREQTLFRSTEFGDDVDRALLKSDGSYTYFAPDIAYHRNKYRRGFKHMIIVLGADHGGYVKRLSAAVKALSGGEADIDVKLCQIVRLFKGGQPYKMSKRAGSFITARDLVDEVGPGPVRFMMLYRKNDAQLDFDLEKVVEQSNDNPVFYVQYAHARACSVISKAQEGFPGLNLGSSSLACAKLNLLRDEAELALIKKIAQFPRMVEGAAQAHEPHRIAFYAHDLAAVFHSLWTRGKESPQLRFMVEGSWDITEARLALITAMAHVLRSCLDLLGVEAVSEMR
jgi:arginyl-tRNA synthetase